MPHPALHGASHWCALSPLLFVAALLIPLAPASSAQQALYDVPAKFPGDQVGHALALSPDVDGDGYPDLLVSVRGRRIEWRSGRGGAPLNHFVPPVALATFGSSIASAGDVDADGAPDVIAGAYELSYFPACYEGCVGFTPGRAFVFSGADGSVLHELGEQFGSDYEFGWSVSGLGDVDGDGHDDVAVGAPAFYYAWNKAAGHVTAFSGADGSPIWTRTGDALGDAFGTSLARLEDRDGDGVGELAVGASGGAYVSILSGADGAEQLRLGGGSNVSDIDVSSAGDVDGDGVEDVAVVMELYSLPALGGLIVFSGADGRVLSSAVPALAVGLEPWGFGIGLSGGADVDGDGAPDLVVGCTSRGAVGILRNDGSVVGVHGSFTQGVISTLMVDTRAAVPLLLPDQTGDGRAEIALGEPWAPGGGRVTVLSGAPDLWTDLGSATSGGLFDIEPALMPFGSLEVGAGLAFQVRSPLFSRLPQQTPARLVIGLGDASVPVFGGVLVPSSDLLLPFTAYPFGSQTAAEFTVPPGLPPGLELFVQAIIMAPVGYGPPLLSNAVRAVTP
ncbi:MAG: FG-GAP repeat domain-containing protein [Planctomycetota bacterium]|jgi:hypothetical protein